jgi:hypothetical protein
MTLKIEVRHEDQVHSASWEPTVYAAVDGYVSWPTVVLTPPNRLPAGSMELELTDVTHAATDQNCGFSITILELPF